MANNVNLKNSSNSRPLGKFFFAIFVIIFIVFLIYIIYLAFILLGAKNIGVCKKIADTYIFY